MTTYLSTAGKIGLVIILNLLLSDGRVIYFGNCPIVIGEKCDSTLVKFYLYSRSDPNESIYVEFNDDGTNNLTSSIYNASLGNKVIIHGYGSDMKLNVLQNLKNEYLVANDINLWMVNYGELVITPCYVFAVYNIRYVGKCVASFIQTLKTTANTTSELDVHIIGFSLGGQVPNHVAQNLPFKLPRITALDPALPLFYTSVLSQRLDPSDALFVDVIHTNALFQGQVFPCGHVDFYVNGGVFQPGCKGLFENLGCDHSRSVEYFAESINTKVGFWGWKCSSFLDFVENKCQPKQPLELMGEYVDSGSPGVYLLNTASQSPYALGQNITVIDSQDIRPQYSIGELMKSNYNSNNLNIG